MHHLEKIERFVIIENSGIELDKQKVANDEVIISLRQIPAMIKDPAIISDALIIDIRAAIKTRK